MKTCSYILVGVCARAHEKQFSGAAKPHAVSMPIPIQGGYIMVTLMEIIIRMLPAALSLQR